MAEDCNKNPGFWTKLNERPWDELIAESWGGYASPITTHLPIHAALSPDFLHVGPAFQVVRQRIIPGLSANDLEALQRVAHEQTMLVQFAFGDPPFVPDFRRTHLSLEEGRWPIAHAEYYMHEGLLYRFEYFSRTLPDDASQSILWICGSITNDKQRTLKAHIRAKVNFPHEDEILDYHYLPFYWDASKMQPSPNVTLAGREILFEGRCIGKVNRGDFECEWEPASDYADKDYGRPAVEFSPPHASLRYKQVRDVVHLHTVLKPAESASFELAFLVNYEGVTGAHQRALHEAGSTQDRGAALEYCQSLIRPENAQLECSADNWSDVFTHLPLNTLQLMVCHGDAPGWIPTEGGSSERHFIWVGEALHMLVPLLKLGYFEAVRQGLEFVFSFQDSGFKPMGRLASTEGAIGTSGPKWLNSTGAALSIAAEYYLYSHDEEFLNNFLPRMLRGVDWIVNEIKATRRLNVDGTRPHWYGLMPFGCANDGDIGYFVSFTDAYTFAGLDKVLSVLEQTGHVRAPELRDELEQYRNDIGQAIANLARPDGFIDRKIVTGDPEEDVYKPFDRVCGAFHLVPCGALEADTPLFDSYVKWMEREMGDDLFVGRMDHDTAYMGWPEWAWQEVYLRRGEWKKAFALNQINLKYAKSADAHQVQERFRISDPTFCPWQPNGSGNGRIIDIMLKSFYFEYRGVATLLAGIPLAWLRRNKTTSLRNLHTSQGVLSLYAEMLHNKRCALRLSADDPKVLPRRLRLPEHFAVEIIENSATLQDGEYTLAPDATSFQCVISSRE